MSLIVAFEGDTDIPIIEALAKDAHFEIANRLDMQGKLIEFGSTTWSLARACKRSESLRRARAALRKMAARWKSFAGEAD